MPPIQSSSAARSVRPGLARRGAIVSSLALLTAAVSAYAAPPAVEAGATLARPAEEISLLAVANLPDAPVPAADLLPQSSTSTQPADDAAQTPATTPPPPLAQQQAQADQSATPGAAHQTKRIAGIIPNYRSVSADQHLPPQSAKQKFAAAGHDSFDYGSFILAAVQAGFSIEGNSYPEFGKGVLGYGRYYWRTLLDTADENFMVGGVLPSALHQDNRFYTLGHGSFAHRALYASTRVLITRGDNGNAEPNFSEIIGAGAASGISSTYYPEHYRTWTKVGQKWLTGVLIDSGNFTFKEFWPDINKHVFHNRD